MVRLLTHRCEGAYFPDGSGGAEPCNGTAHCVLPAAGWCQPRRLRTLASTVRHDRLVRLQPRTTLPLPGHRPPRPVRPPSLIPGHTPACSASRSGLLPASSPSSATAASRSSTLPRAQCRRQIAPIRAVRIWSLVLPTDSSGPLETAVPEAYLGKRSRSRPCSRL